MPSVNTNLDIGLNGRRRQFIKPEPPKPETPAIHKEIKQVLSEIEFDRNSVVENKGSNLLKTVEVIPWGDEGDSWFAQIKLTLNQSPISVNWNSFPDIVVSKIDGNDEVVARMGKFYSPLTNEISFVAYGLSNHGKYKIKVNIPE